MLRRLAEAKHVPERRCPVVYDQLGLLPAATRRNATTAARRVLSISVPSHHPHYHPSSSTAHHSSLISIHPSSLLRRPSMRSPPSGTGPTISSSVRLPSLAPSPSVNVLQRSADGQFAFLTDREICIVVRLASSFPLRFSINLSILHLDSSSLTFLVLLFTP